MVVVEEVVATLVVGDSKAPVEAPKAVLVLITVAALYLPPILPGIEGGGDDKKGVAAGNDILERGV